MCNVLCEYILSLLLDTPIEVKSLGQMVTLWRTSFGSAKLFSKGVYIILSYQECMEVQYHAHLYGHLFLPLFLTLAILEFMTWNFIDTLT